MARLVTVSSICERLEHLAKERGLRSLSMWLKLAANDAYLHDLKTEARDDSRIGIWDWDIPNNLDHTNPTAADFFGIAAESAARGRPVEDYIKLVHQDDVPSFVNELERTTAHGGIFSLDFRVIANDRIRWLSAYGTCSLDQNGRPIRMMGSLMDVTNEMQNNNIFAYAQIASEDRTHEQSATRPGSLIVVSFRQDTSIRSSMSISRRILKKSASAE